jgi:hypothetical protein
MRKFDRAIEQKMKIYEAVGQVSAPNAPKTATQIDPKTGQPVVAQSTPNTTTSATTGAGQAAVSPIAGSPATTETQPNSPTTPQIDPKTGRAITPTVPVTAPTAASSPGTSGVPKQNVVPTDAKTGQPVVADGITAENLPSVMDKIMGDTTMQKTFSDYLTKLKAKAPATPAPTGTVAPAPTTGV